MFCVFDCFLFWISALSGKVPVSLLLEANLNFQVDSIQFLLVISVHLDKTIIFKQPCIIFILLQETIIFLAYEDEIDSGHRKQVSST